MPGAGHCRLGRGKYSEKTQGGFRYVQLSKKRKKEQKKFHAMQRKTWNGLNPVTRTVPNGKGYDRNRQKQEFRRSSRDYQGDADGKPAGFLNKWLAIANI